MVQKIAALDRTANLAGRWRGQWDEELSFRRALVHQVPGPFGRPVRRAQLELRVLAAVDALRRGERVEDDLIECKRVWPDPVKAPRQLAGSANRAAGEPIIWIIGVDEDTGQVHARGADDPANWWAQVGKRFDQTPPDLLHHATVHVGTEETVVALAFRTDAAPYLVTTSGGSPEREVPLRVGTSTRSAHRHELLRILRPATTVPPADLLEAHVTATWHGATPTTDERPSRTECTTLGGSAKIYLEYVGSRAIVLPAHRMRAMLTSGEITLSLEASVSAPYHSSDSPPPPPPPFGVTTTRDGVVCTGPGGFLVELLGGSGDDQRGQWGQVSIWRLDIELGVVSAARPLRLTADLHRQQSGHEYFGGLLVDVGRWETARSPLPASAEPEHDRGHD